MVKGGNSNRAYNTLNMNTKIPQEVIAAFHNSHPNDNIIPTQFQMPRMGRQIIVNVISTYKDVSVTGSGISKYFSIQYDEDDRISSIGISKITNRNLHVSSNNSTNHDSEIGYNSTIEIDIHAYTHCFGKKFRIVSPTEQLCSVHPFIYELDTTNNASIVTAATSVVDDYGTLFATVCVQGINFTNKMYKVVINTNQFRSFGVQ